MHLNDKERQAISIKETLTDEAKRAKIKEWDLEVWTSFTPKVKAHKKNSDAYWCYCPHCEKGAKVGTHNLTGLVYAHSNGDGLGFTCKACGAKHPRVYEFLGKGSEAAENYAEKRLEIGAVGKGWYCPAPQRHKQQQEQEKRDRAEKYKADYERNRREKKIAYALREQATLKAAEPRTRLRSKGSCSVSQDES